jgi:hypothetical protein
MSRCPANNRPLTESERRREFLEAGPQQPLDKNENPSTVSCVAALLFFVLCPSGQSIVFTILLYSTTCWGEVSRVAPPPQEGKKRGFAA